MFWVELQWTKESSTYVNHTHSDTHIPTHPSTTTTTPHTHTRSTPRVRTLQAADLPGVLRNYSNYDPLFLSLFEEHLNSGLIQFHRLLRTVAWRLVNGTAHDLARRSLQRLAVVTWSETLALPGHGAVTCETREGLPQQIYRKCLKDVYLLNFNVNVFNTRMWWFHNPLCYLDLSSSVCFFFLWFSFFFFRFLSFSFIFFLALSFLILVFSILFLLSLPFFILISFFFQAFFLSFPHFLLVFVSPVFFRFLL